MNTIISFPRPAHAASREDRKTVNGRSSGPITLFVHVKRATLIAHLAAQGETGAAGTARSN